MEARCEEARQEGREEDHQEEAGEEGRLQEEVSASWFSTRSRYVDFLLFGPVNTGGRVLAWVTGLNTRAASDMRCFARACCELAAESTFPRGRVGWVRGRGTRPAA